MKTSVITLLALCIFITSLCFLRPTTTVTIPRDQITNMTLGGTVTLKNGCIMQTSTTWGAAFQVMQIDTTATIEFDILSSSCQL